LDSKIKSVDLRFSLIWNQQKFFLKKKTKMKRIFLQLSLLIFCLFISFSTSLIHSIDEDYNEKIKSGIWFIEFVAPGLCDNCGGKDEILEEASKHFGNKINFGKVNVLKNQNAKNQFDILKYPVFFLFRDNLLYPFKAPEMNSLKLIKFLEEGYSEVQGLPIPQLKSYVIELTDSNFDSLIQKGDWLLEFYAPWCGHCKQLAPTYDQVSVLLEGKTNVATIDVTSNPLLVKRFEVRSMPTIFFYKDGKLIDYDGERSAQDFVHFVKQGYSSKSSKPLPGPLNGLEIMMEKFLSLIRPYVRVNIMYLLPIVGFASLIMGFILGRITAPTSEITPKKKND